MAERITPRSKDFSQWYLDIIQHAQLADQSPVRGCLVLKPNGYALWEVVQRELDRRFKETGHRNAYFPMFIPESFLQKEKDHVEGFAPQCAVVTHGGGKKLDEPLIVRPTSETIINSMYAKWIQSYRDLPVLINQWANVVRWEMRTRPFLRTMEFLWQEGHTCHETAEEAISEMRQMLEIYRSFLADTFAIATVAGEKTPSEKFAGAETTVCIEAMMQDKKALQAATSHYFGDRFARAFAIKFQDRTGKEQFVHQTSWGISTRIIGALIMTHSDDQGLVLPPKAAPTEIVIVPILQKNRDNAAVLEAANRLKADLSKRFRVHIDLRDSVSAGFKFHEWEVQGVPLRVELGPRDLAEGKVVLAPRVGEKRPFSLDGVVDAAATILDELQSTLLRRSEAFLKANTFEENDYGKFRTLIEERPGFYSMPWCGSATCETQVKEETKATIRCIPFDRKKTPAKCVVCGSPAEGPVLFARSY
jgi:prolyl-tRNA synthetase